MKGTAGRHSNRSEQLFVLSNGIGVAMLGYIALSALLTFVWEGWAANRTEAVQAAVSLGRYAFSLLVPFALVGWALRDRIPPVDHQKPVRNKRFVVAAFAAGFGTAGFGNLLAWLMQLTAAKEGVELTTAAAIESGDPLAWIITFVGYSLLAALVEEVVFRGVVLRMLRPWGDLWAVWCSAALFALCHASPLQFLPALLTGALLGIFTVITDGIGLAVAVHTCYNALALLLNGLLEGQERVWPVLVIWGILMAAGLAAVPQLLSAWNRCRIRWDERTKDFYVAPFMLLAAAFMSMRILSGVVR